MTVRTLTIRRIAAGVGLSGLALMGVLAGCSSKNDQAPSTSTPSSATEKSMTNQGPNSFAPTAHGTTPSIGANDNNAVTVPEPPHPPGPPPGGPMGGPAGGPGGAPGGRH